MGNYAIKGPRGFPVNFRISGNTPTPTEMERINAVLTGQPMPGSQTQASTEDSRPGLLGILGFYPTNVHNLLPLDAYISAIPRITETIHHPAILDY